jgi:hypothetical protein
MSAQQIQMFSDVKNVYFNGRVTPVFIAKVFLLSAIATFFVGFTMLVFGKALEQNLITGVLLVVMSLLIILPLGRYFSWNIYGEEHVTINKNNILYQHNFGFARTNLKKIPHNGELSFDFEITGVTEQREEGILHIFEMETNKSYKKLYSTAVRLTEQQADEFIKNIEKVFGVPSPKIKYNYSLN